VTITADLHFVWVGDESKRPDKAIDSWRRHNPSFNIRVWGNDDLKSGWMLSKLMRHYWHRELCGVADCMRWEILYRYGGIALDADSEAVSPIPDWVLEPDIWCCWESEVLRPGLLANGAMGSVPGHPLIGQIIEDLSKSDPGELQAWQHTGPVRLTTTWMEHQFRDLTIWPSHLFLPDHFAGLPYSGRGPVIATQGWHSTRGKW
jgi:mannosyltransferase OCH1-like enzyme